MAKKNIPKIKASTQDHLDIEDIAADIIILKTGWIAMVLTITAVNFDILSEAEQDATIYAYGALLNSLSFPIQILVRSKKADITTYFHNLSEAAASQQNPDLKRQIEKYQEFLQSIVQQKTVLDKKFYMIVSFSPAELGIKKLKGAVPKNSKDQAQLITQAKATLTPKKDHLIKQAARLGLNATQLNTQELIELLYDIYNPAPTGTQRVLLDTTAYTTPIVQPAVEVPTTAYQQTQPASPPIQPRHAQSAPINQTPPPNQPLAATNQPQPPMTQQDALKNLREAVAKAGPITGQSTNTQVNQNTDQQIQGSER